MLYPNDGTPSCDVKLHEAPTQPKRIYAEPTIKVYLLRQISVETRGQKAWRNTVIAEGELGEVPPVVSPPCESAGTGHLDWEGELQVGKDLSVGGFQTANVAVKVYISENVSMYCLRS
jgi:hypothetical protein